MIWWSASLTRGPNPICVDFCIVHKKNVFYILNASKTSKVKYCFLTCENVKFKFQSPQIKFYWKSSTLIIYVLSITGSHCSSRIERLWQTVCTQSLKYLPSGCFTEKLYWPLVFTITYCLLWAVVVFSFVRGWNTHET